MDRIIMRGLEFYGYHGVLPEEHRLGQRFLVDVELQVELQAAGRADDLRLTIDYGEVYRQIKSVVEGPPLSLIEAVAERIAATLLGWPPVSSVVVRVHKPGAPIPGPFGMISVEIERERKG